MKFKFILSLSLLFFFMNQQLAAQDKVSLYHPDANVFEELAQALDEAKDKDKHVFIQVGGNWCSWCILFHNFIEEHADVKEAFEANYVAVKLNYSKENKNEEILAQLGYPNRFGFPVFVILDGNGNRLHTQNSAFLEEGKGYNKENVIQFFSNWSPTAVDPATYKNN